MNRGQRFLCQPASDYIRRLIPGVRVPVGTFTFTSGQYDGANEEQLGGKVVDIVGLLELFFDNFDGVPSRGAHP